MFCWIHDKLIRIYKSTDRNADSIFFNPLLSFGKPGVEFYGQHTNHDSAVTQLVFLPNEVSPK